MTFASDQQRKWFFATKGADSGSPGISFTRAESDTVTHQRIWNDANDAIGSKDYGEGKAYESYKDALYNREAAAEWLDQRGFSYSLPKDISGIQLSEAQLSGIRDEWEVAAARIRADGDLNDKSLWDGARWALHDEVERIRDANERNLGK